MRALFLPSAVGRSHLTRLILVAEALRERGTDVVFAYGGRHGDLLDGYEQVPVADVPDADPRGDVFAAYDAEVVEQAVVDVTRAARETGADRLVFDLHPAGPIAAYAAGLPCASITDAALTAAFDVAGVFGDAARPLAAVQGRAGAWSLRRVAEAHGLRDRRSLYDFALGDVTLLADLEEWTPVTGLAPGARYVGPLVWEDEGELPGGFDPARTVYLTLSNTAAPRLLEAGLEAFGPGSGFQLLVSTGPGVEPPPDAPGLHARRLLPGGAAARAAALVVHAGTSGTTYQALAAIRPMVVVPSSVTGRINARLVTRHRVGAGFEPEKLDPARLRDAAERILAVPGYKIGAARFARLIEAADGPAAAADAVMGLAA